jgi:pimeloyl-ACP methyl ester carboxylesterase
MLPTALIQCSTTNESNTDNDISVMGLRLADEVRMTIQRNFEDPKEAIINFVGHSMGGIIARACLSRLPQFQDQLGFFFSLSTPHLGYLNGVDAMIKAGLWFMRKMNKVKSLDQLAMEDAESLKETLLYKLS